MALQKLKFRPGINRDATSYTNEGGWFDCNKIRFRAGLPEKIGGWSRYSDNTFTGTCRSLHTWTALDNTDFIGVGTSQKYYVNSGGKFYDITPIRATTGAGDVTFSATNGSSTVTVTDTAHGALINDFVTFSGAATLGGTVTATVLNQEYQIASIVSGNSYTITAKDTSGDAVTANGSDTGSGGGSVVGVYQLNIGLDSNSYSNGWGAGIWGGVDIDPITTTWAEEIDASETDVDVASATGIAASSGDIIESGGELMLVGSISSTTLTVTRDYAGTAAATHATGSAVRLAKGNATATDDYVTLINGSSLASDADATSATVDSAAAFPSSGLLLIEEELIQYTGTTSTTFTGLVRGAHGTTKATHADDEAVIEATYGWGMPAATTVSGAQLRSWSQDNFGEDLVANVRDGGIYYWDRSAGTGARAVNITALTGSTNAPTVAKKVIISERDRHILVFGCDSESVSGTLDPLLIRFGSQESLTEWNALATNTAGELRIGTGSEIVTAVQTKQQTLVITDISVHALQFIGPPYTFGITEVGRNTTIISENAAVAVEESVYWMGYREFYVYNGRTQKLPCSVQDYVFNNLNRDQDTKIIAGQNSAYSEVWWFYPSSDSTNNDSYVVYNYEQNVWYYGTLARTAWVDRGVLLYPIAASTDNYLYYQEFGLDDGSTNPAQGITSYVESSQVTIGDGDNFFSASRVIPDVTFRESTASSPSVNVVVKARRYPGTTYETSDTNSITQSASSPIELYTEKADIRLRGRSFAFRLESSDAGVTWRLGTPRIDVRQDGRR